MKRVIIVIIIFMFFGLCGCGSEENPVWERVKISELAPRTDPNGPNAGELGTTNFSIYIYNVEPNSLPELSSLWDKLHAGAVLFYERQAFGDNNFKVGFGQAGDLRDVAESMASLKARRQTVTSLLLTDNQPQDITIRELSSQRTVFYTSVKQSTNAVTIGPGELTLRFSSRKLPERPELSQVTAQPAVPSRSPVEDLLAPEERKETSDLLFESLKFYVKVSPGDFFLLGPGQPVENQQTLPGLFFYRQQPEPHFKVYLAICTAVSD